MSRSPELATTVTFTLESTSSGTRLRLEHTGFDNAGEMGARFRAGADHGWGRRFLSDTLPAFLAKAAVRS